MLIAEGAGQASPAASDARTKSRAESSLQQTAGLPFTTRRVTSTDCDRLLLTVRGVPHAVPSPSSARTYLIVRKDKFDHAIAGFPSTTAMLVSPSSDIPCQSATT